MALPIARAGFMRCDAFETTRSDRNETHQTVERRQEIGALYEAMFSLRMPQDLRDALAVAARKDERTAASLLKAILRKWLVNNGHLKAT
jgi:hypothetical protein